MLKGGKLQLITKDLRPNGLAFSPDEKYIYLVDGTTARKPFGVLTCSRMTRSPTGNFFIDMTPDKAPGGRMA